MKSACSDWAQPRPSSQAPLATEVAPTPADAVKYKRQMTSRV